MRHRRAKQLRQLGDIRCNPSHLIVDYSFAAGGCKRLLSVNRPTLMRYTSGADALHPVFEAPAVSVSVRARWRSPLHAPRNRIRENAQAGCTDGHLTLLLGHA